MLGYTCLFLFMMTVPAANWLIGNVGTHCIPNGPCLLPMGFGFEAPSGVLMIGLALVLRDIVHRQLGWKWATGAIFAGAALSMAIAPGALVLASGLAFLLSEMADLVVYHPLYKKRLITAVVASSIAGALVDSAIFLYVAFGSFQFLGGQWLGKTWMVLATIPVIHLIRRWTDGDDQRSGPKLRPLYCPAPRRLGDKGTETDAPDQM